MFTYVARQAIVDSNEQLHGYELLFRDGEDNRFPDIEPDEATSKLLTGTHLNNGIEGIVDESLAFINFHHDTLQHRFPTSLNPATCVIEIIETTPVNEGIIESCKQLRRMGYTLALDDYDFASKWQPLLPFIGYLKIDISEHELSEILPHVAGWKDSGLKLIAERVETYEQYEQCRSAGFDYFQGFYFAKPVLMRSKSIQSTGSVIFELIDISGRAEFDFELVNEAISKDVALSYMLLRFINNPAMSKRNEIQSLKHALNYMGEAEVKKFIALVVLANLTEGKATELAVMALTRAKFCELVARVKKESENPPQGFLLGLFSLLDAMLDQNMSELVKRLPLGENLKSALIGKTSSLLAYLDLIKGFEQGYWSKIDKQCIELNLDKKLIYDFYHESIKWADTLKSGLRN